MVQTLASRLRHIYAAQNPNIVLKTTPRKITKQGQPMVIFYMHDYMHTLTVDGKYSLVGKFSTTMARVEIKKEKSFIE